MLTFVKLTPIFDKWPAEWPVGAPFIIPAADVLEVTPVDTSRCDGARAEVRRRNAGTAALRVRETVDEIHAMLRGETPLPVTGPAPTAQAAPCAPPDIDSLWCDTKHAEIVRVVSSEDTEGRVDTLTQRLDGRPNVRRSWSIAGFYATHCPYLPGETAARALSRSRIVAGQTWQRDAVTPVIVTVLSVAETVLDDVKHHVVTYLHASGGYNAMSVTNFRTLYRRVS